MKKLLVTLFAILFLIPLSPVLYSRETVWQKTQNIKFSGGSRTVTAIYVDMSDKTIRMESVLAKKQIGKVDDLKNIAMEASTENQKVLGAINGTFFNAYTTDQQPSSTIESKGTFQFNSETGCVIGFTGDNSVMIERLKVVIKGSKNGSFDYPNNWDAWGFNNTQINADTIFTPAFGKVTSKTNGTSFVVEKGIITKKVKGSAEIPSDGFTLSLNNANYINRFSVGDRIGYKLDFMKLLPNGKTSPLNWKSVRTTVGAGPTLLKSGVILADGKSENFKEDKINQNRGQRSFIGITKNNILVLGTVPNVSVKELAEIIKKLGLYHAMNLDGGASSGLYYNGKYITPPGRKLSNALVITKLQAPPYRLILNGEELFYPHDSYQNKSGILMVPLKNLLNTFGGTLDSSGYTAKRGKTVYEFKNGSSTVKVNGVEKEMGSSLEFKAGIVFAPLDFLIQSFGGTISVDNTRRIFTIQCNEVSSDLIYQSAVQAFDLNDFAKAENLLQKVLELDPFHSSALLKLAKLYSSNKAHAEAAKHYERYFSVNSTDFEKLSSAGWAYYRAKDFTSSEGVFRRLTQLQPASASNWIALGDIYSLFTIGKYEEAILCYKKALTLNPSASQITAISNALNRIK